MVDEAAPALLQDGDTVRATHADWSLISAENPALPGEVIVLFGTGLGPPNLRLDDGEIPPIDYLDISTLFLRRLEELKVLVGGVAVEPERIWYAGLVPGTAGLYQINLHLPDVLAGPDPDLQFALGESLSPILRLPAQIPQLSSPQSRLNNQLE
jgi:uncharacterized protein (TIGR03437 family)